jgi:hypothetical protein
MVRYPTDHVHYTPEDARRAAAKIIGDVPRLRTLRGPAAGG